MAKPTSGRKGTSPQPSTESMSYIFYTDIRTYPLPLMAESMRLIQQEHGVRFLICGENKDAGRLAELRSLAEAVGVREVDVRTPSTFLDFAALVPAARGA